MDLTVQLSNPRDALRQLCDQDISAHPSQIEASSDAARSRKRMRQPQRRLTPHEIEALVAAYRGGMTMKELAAAFGIHRVTASAYLRRHGVPIRGRGLDNRHVAEAARLYESGWSSWTLSKKFDVTPNTVLKALRAANVDIRPRQGGPPPKLPPS